MSEASKRVLWWGRFDPDYSRNRILFRAFKSLGWQVLRFTPRFSKFGDIEALVRRLPKVDAVFVPCFRHRDIAAAWRYCERHATRLIIDPLISAYDKQVFEREKFDADSREARKLLRWEQKLFQLADLVLADTREHARYFGEKLGVDAERLHVVHVGAEQPLFSPAAEPKEPGDTIEALFVGSFIALQGPTAIIEAARALGGRKVHWVMLGDGPLFSKCQRRAQGLSNVSFEPWVPYDELPARIQRADILLGIFGNSAKAGRVIPNKVYQALACGKPVVTRTALCYPAALLEAKDQGILFVPAGNPKAIAKAVRHLAAHADLLHEQGRRARAIYDQYFSPEQIEAELAAALHQL